jgi:3-deoxy-manno-octulosonate cytidylyltransferase (CMP-KDO synthetase)
MKLIVIPARLDSSRLPGKVLLPGPDGKPLIQHVWEIASRSRSADHVLVATDSDVVAATVTGFGGTVRVTAGDFPTGTDRVYHAVRDAPLVERVVNLQADELGVTGEELDLLLDSKEDRITLACPITSRQFVDSNCVKVLVDGRGDAAYFTRWPLPHGVMGDSPNGVYKHLGAYGLSMPTLEYFAATKQGDWELREYLEQLRLLQAGLRWAVRLVPARGRSINTKEDYDRWVNDQAGQVDALQAHVG